MKTYMNGQVRHVDSEMATKYQLSKVYTKVQSTINSMSAALSGEISDTNTNLANLDARFVEKSNQLDNADRQLGVDIREVSDTLTQNTKDLNQDIQIVSSALDTNVQTIHTTINSVEQDLTNKIDITATNASAYTDITNTNLVNTNNHLANTRLELDNVDTSLSASIDSLSTTLYNEKDIIMQWATLKDDDLKRDLSAYIDESIANLGSVYELIGTLPDKSIATSVDDLPSGAEKGDIYFIKSTLSDGTSAITQYICIDSAPDVSRYDKWQKFGTTVDLSNYYTIDEVKAADEAILYSANTTSTNQVTTLDNTLRSLIDQTARNAATDASTKSNDALTSGKAYTDELIGVVKQTAINNVTTINDRITATTDELNATITNAASSTESKSNAYTDKVSGLLSGYLTTDITKILTDADTVTLNNAKAYTDSEIVRLNDILVYADGQALLSAKNYTDSVSTQINTLMINGDAAAKDAAIKTANDNIAALKSTLESADSAVLVNAKAYTDFVSGKLQTFYKDLDAQLLSDSKTYSDNQNADLKSMLEQADGTVLTEAKTYTDSAKIKLQEILSKGDLDTLSAAKQQITRQIESTLQIVNDEKLNAVASAKIYTDQVSGKLNTLYTNADTALSTALQQYSVAKDEQLKTQLITTINTAKTEANGYTDNTSAALKAMYQNADNALKDALQTYIGQQDTANYNTLTGRISDTGTAVYNDAKTYTDTASAALKAMYQQADIALNAALQNYVNQQDTANYNTLTGRITDASGAVYNAAKTYTDNADKELTRLYENADIALKEALQTYIGQQDTALHQILSTEIKNAKDAAIAYTNTISGNIADLYGKDDTQIIGIANRYSEEKDSELRTQLLISIDGAVINANNHTNQVSAALQKALEDRSVTIKQDYTSADVENYNNAKSYTDERERLTREVASSYTDHVSGLLSTAVINYTKQQTDILNTSITTNYNELNNSINSKYDELSTSINSKYNELSTAIDNLDLHDVIDAHNYTDSVSSILSAELTNNILAAATQELTTQINTLSTIYAPKASENIQTDTAGKPDFGTLSGNTIYDLNADSVITMLTFHEAKKSYLESIIYFKTGNEFTLVMPENIAYIQNGIEFDAITKRPVFKPNTRYIITVRNLVARIETIEEPAAEPAADPETVTEE